MLGVQNERDVHRLFMPQRGICPKQHIEAIRRERAPRLWRDRFLTMFEAMMCGHNNWQLSKQPLGFANVGIVAVVADFRVPVGEHARAGTEYVHREGGGREVSQCIDNRRRDV